MAANPNTSDASASTLSMKLLIDTKSQRVLYAEAGKDVVDFLFSLLTLPVGTVVKILSQEAMVGSIGNLYGSVEELDETYVHSARAKKALLSPTTGGCAGGNKLLQLPEAPAPQPPCTQQFYRCPGHDGYTDCYNNVTKSRGSPCPVQYCYENMTVPVRLVGKNTGSDDTAAAATSALAAAGFVQGVVTYTVMDDLKVAPMSTISGITMLNTFGITDIGSLLQKTVQVGYDEGLEILRVALQSKTVLTDVFLGKKRKA